MPETALSATIDGKPMPVSVRRMRRARRLILRFDVESREIRLTLPWRVSLAEGKRFVETQGPWLQKRMAVVVERVPFSPGATVPVLGEPHLIEHAPGRGGVRWETGRIVVAAALEHVPRRVEAALRARALAELSARSAAMATALGEKLRQVRVRDMRSRWGSCAKDGRIGYNWRLILAPAYVLDYVVAHEVAHLREHHHGPAFWDLCGRLAEDATKARHWLKANGSGLFRMGGAAAESETANS